MLLSNNFLKNTFSTAEITLKQGNSFTLINSLRKTGDYILIGCDKSNVSQGIFSKEIPMRVLVGINLLYYELVHKP